MRIRLGIIGILLVLLGGVVAMRGLGEGARGERLRMVVAAPAELQEDALTDRPEELHAEALIEQVVQAEARSDDDNRMIAPLWRGTSSLGPLVPATAERHADYRSPYTPAAPIPQHASAEKSRPPAPLAADDNKSEVQVEVQVKTKHPPGTIWLDVPEVMEVGKEYEVPVMVESGQHRLADAAFVLVLDASVFHVTLAERTATEHLPLTRRFEVWGTDPEWPGGAAAGGSVLLGYLGVTPQRSAPLATLDGERDVCHWTWMSPQVTVQTQPRPTRLRATFLPTTIRIVEPRDE